MLLLKYIPKVYIAGPMRGLPDFNYPVFNRAAEVLRFAGYRVFNPAESFDGDTSLPFHVYMREDIKNLAQCDFIFFLSGSIASEGAVEEAQIARLCKIPHLTLEQVVEGYGLC